MIINFRRPEFEMPNKVKIKADITVQPYKDDLIVCLMRNVIRHKRSN